MKLNQYIDHTILKPRCNRRRCEAICMKLWAYELLLSSAHHRVRLVSRLLSGSPVKTQPVVVGFPTRTMAVEAKAFPKQSMRGKQRRRRWIWSSM